MDAVFAQDLGLGSFGMLRSNEAYTSQYIDHEPLKDGKLGYIICSRQGQKQDKGFPWIMHGCLNTAAAYLVDGFQFYGLGYKESGVPEALTKPRLPSARLQYEFALPTLQTEKVTLAPGAHVQWAFFASFQDNHPAANGKKDLSVALKAQAEYPLSKTNTCAFG